MQVGGCEVGFDHVFGTHAGDVFGVIKSVWPLARFEDHGVDTSGTDANQESIEFFAYRNFAAHCAINKVGIEDYLRDDFMHVILKFDKNHARVIVGERNREKEKLFHLLEEKLGWKKCKYYQAAS